MTRLMYAECPDLWTSTAQILHQGSDLKGIYFVLNQSLFYPQGGGQPADQGEIRTENAVYKVFDVRNVDDEIRHYIIDNNQAIDAGRDMTMHIDKDRRVLYSQYHTAGHLIAAIAEKINPEIKTIKGHQFPGEAYVEFDGAVHNTDDFLVQIEVSVRDAISCKGPVQTKELQGDDLGTIAKECPYVLPKDKALRVCHITGFSPVPCGGTHVKTLDDISFLALTKCKSKKGKTKIHYAF